MDPEIPIDYRGLSISLRPGRERRPKGALCHSAGATKLEPAGAVVETSTIRWKSNQKTGKVSGFLWGFHMISP